MSHFKAFHFFSFNTQVDSFLQTRTLALQRHQNRFQNRSLPFQRSGSGLGGGGGGGGGFGFVRNYGGTGVFLPRISSTTTTSPNPTATDDSRKKQGELLPFFFLWALLIYLVWISAFSALGLLLCLLFILVPHILLLLLVAFVFKT